MGCYPTLGTCQDVVHIWSGLGCVLEYLADFALEHSRANLQSLGEKVELPFAKLTAKSCDFLALRMEFHCEECMHDVHQSEQVTPRKAKEDILYPGYGKLFRLNDLVDFPIVNHQSHSLAGCGSLFRQFGVVQFLWHD